jgi:molecular chaperone GrpE
VTSVLVSPPAAPEVYNLKPARKLIEHMSEDAEAARADDTEAAADETDADATALVEEVAAHDEELADEVAALDERRRELEETVAELESERDDLESRLKRTQADFQNYKKRAKKRQDQIRDRATEDLVERLVTVRDDLVRALEQDEDVDIRDGVEATLKEFDRVLEDENVAVIEPQPGDEVDPKRHEVMMRVESDQPAGTVAGLYQAGYEMADKVIRAAQITVSEDGE